MAEFPYFLWLNNISLYVYTMFSLSIYLSTDLGFFPGLAVVNNAAVNMAVQVSL